MISNLQASSNELTEMGNKDVGQVFTFNEISKGEVGGTESVNGIIVMTVLSGSENKIHEAAHGYQLYKGTMSSNSLDREIIPYSRQYSFNPASFNANVPSYWGSIQNLSNINDNFVLGIHDSNNNYIYSPLKDYRRTESWLDELKKETKTQ